MPPKWQQVLDDNGITQDEQERNPNGVMAVVQYLKHQDEGEDEEEEVWAKMKNAQPPAFPPPSAAPSQPTTPGGGVGSREMSREPSNEALGAAGTQVVDFTCPRMAPAPPTKPSLNRMLVCFFFFFRVRWKKSTDRYSRNDMRRLRTDRPNSPPLPLWQPLLG